MNLILQILRCWLHGIQTKTGAEPWLLAHYTKENHSFPRGSQRNPRTEKRELYRKYAARLDLRKRDGCTYNWRTYYTIPKTFEELTKTIFDL